MITFADLFCGIGGFRKGIEDAAKELNIPVKCVFSSEIEKNAVKIYEKNFGETPSGDITKINPIDIPRIDILCGGFPCQPFSIAGKRKGFDDDRGGLFFEIMKIALEKQPNILFLENVEGLLSSKFEIPSYYAVKLLNDEIIEGTLWEENFTPKNNWKEFEICILAFIQEISQMNSDLLIPEFVTSYTKSSINPLGKKGFSVENTLLKNLQYLVTQLLQIMRNTNSFQTEQMDLLEEHVVVLNLNLKRLFSTGNILLWDTRWLDLTVLTLGEIEKSCRKSLEESYLMMNMFTTSMETNQTTDLKICMYVQKINITLFIVKQWMLSTTFWKRVLSSSIEKPESTYYVKTFNIVLQTVLECGYDCEWKLLNSKDFGVPQNRERIYILGHLRSIPTPQIFQSIPETPGVCNKFDKTEKGLCEIASTLTKRAYGSWNGNYVKIGNKYRFVTPLECERLQGFPDNFTEGIEDKYRYECLGNAVTVNVIKAIALKMLQCMD